MTDSMNPFGVWPVMLTPFTETGALDRPGCEALVDWYLAGRVTGIFTGESSVPVVGRVE